MSEQRLRSILGQTVAELELVVVDDASADRTPEILESVDDARLRVLRNDEQLGLAASLNRGLDGGAWRIHRSDRRRRCRNASQAAAPARADTVGAGGCGRRLGGAGARRRWASWSRAHHAHWSPPTSAGLRSSARRSCTLPCLSNVTRSTGTGSDTRRSSPRARTTSCGRGSWTSQTATTCSIHSSSIASTPTRHRSAAVRFSASSSFASRSGRSPRVAPELSPGEQELAWRVGVAKPIALR